MTTTTNTDINTVIGFLGRLLDGEHPTATSPEVGDLASAVGALQRRKSSREFEMLGLEAMGLLIDRMRSEISATQTLQNFFRGVGE